MNGLGRKKEDKKNSQSILTRETLGVVLILFATLCLVCLITRDAVFSVPGKYVNAFLFGCFGMFAYAVDIFVILMGVLLVFDKKTGINAKRKVLVTIFFLLTALITHVITMSGKDLSFGEYVKTSYLMAEGGFLTASGGGLVVSFIAYPITAILTEVGCYVVSGILLFAVAYALIKGRIFENNSAKSKETPKFRSSFVKETVKTENEERSNDKAEIVEETKSGGAKQTLFITNPDNFAIKNKRELNKPETNTNLIQFVFISVF